MIHLFVSDLHACLKLPHAKLNAEGTSSDRLEDVIKVFEEMRAFIISADEPACVWILGDLFHERSPDAPTLTRIARELHNLSCLASVYILPGNHDAHGRNAAVYSLSLLNELNVKGITVLDRPQWVEPEPGLAFFAAPWVPDKQFEDAVDIAESTTWPVTAERVLLMHQTITGALSEGRRLTGIPASCLGRTFADGDPLFHQALSGHIHHPQSFAMPGGAEGFYLGSPIQLNFGEDDGKSRGFYVGKLNDEGYLQVIQHAINDSPQFVRWVFSEDDEDSVTEVFEELWEDFEDEVHGPLNAGWSLYLDVRVIGPREEIDPIATQITTMLASCDENPHIDLRMWRLSRIATDDGAERTTESTGSYTPADMVELFVDVNAATLPDGIDAGALKGIGEKLLG